MMALMTSRNKPKVKTVTGSVKRTRTGFTKILSKAMTVATTIAVMKLLTYTPPNILEKVTTKIAETIR